MRDTIIRILERSPEITIVKLTALAIVFVVCLILGIK